MNKRDDNIIVAEISSEYDHVKELFLAIKGYLLRENFLPEQLTKIELCIAEVANNSVQHAYQMQPGHPILLQVKLESDRLNMQLVDEGLSIPRVCLDHQVDWETVDSDNPDTWAVNGRGLQIVRDIMDEVSYETRGGSNFFTMIMLLDSD